MVKETIVFALTWVLSGVMLDGYTAESIRDEMFYGLEKISSIDMSNLNTSNVEYMQYMFAYCRNITDFDLALFDTKKVENMAGMFQGCELISSLDISNFITPNVQDMAYMFDSCLSLTSINLYPRTISSIDKSLYNVSTFLFTIYAFQFLSKSSKNC